MFLLWCAMNFWGSWTPFISAFKPTPVMVCSDCSWTVLIPNVCPVRALFHTARRSSRQHRSWPEREAKQDEPRDSLERSCVAKGLFWEFGSHTEQAYQVNKLLWFSILPFFQLLILIFMPFSPFYPLSSQILMLTIKSFAFFHLSNMY